MENDIRKEPSYNIARIMVFAMSKNERTSTKRFPVADEWSVRSRYAFQRLSRATVFAGMAGAADSHSRAKPKARTGQEILQT